MSFLGFGEYLREFIKGYADNAYPLQQLMRHKGKKFKRNEKAETAFPKTLKELCEALVPCMSTENDMYVVDADPSGLAISGEFQQGQGWKNGLEANCV